MMVGDFHTHILPGVDDGSRSVSESIEMLKMEAAQGVTRVVATPHFYPQHDHPERFLQRRKEAQALLEAQIQQHDGLPTVYMGAEVYYFAGISDSEILPMLTINGSRYILIEMPTPPWTERMYRELEQIHEKQGLIPVIAHLDRYIAPFHTYGIPQRLAQLPVIVQVNGSFFLRRSTRGLALRMAKEGTVRLLGSDCHDLDQRAPNLETAVQMIRRKLGQPVLERIRKTEDSILNH